MIRSFPHFQISTQNNTAKFLYNSYEYFFKLVRAFFSTRSMVLKIIITWHWYILRGDWLKSDKGVQLDNALKMESGANSIWVCSGSRRFSHTAIFKYILAKTLLLDNKKNRIFLGVDQYWKKYWTQVIRAIELRWSDALLLFRVNLREKFWKTRQNLWKQK